MSQVADTIPFPRSGRVQINVSGEVNVTAVTARRKVNAFLATHLGNLLLADEPALTITDRVVWRVPVDLTNVVDGRIGRVGEVDVDVESGELLLSEEQMTRIEKNALYLAASSPS